MAGSCESHSLPSHKVSNNFRQDQRQKEPQHTDQQRAIRGNHCLDGFKFFTDCYFQFLSVMDKTSIVLPRGQLTHVLRHTFAAHFMMSGGNILALQKILGHHDIKMTMRYAHLAPDHLETALRLNPLATMNNLQLKA